MGLALLQDRAFLDLFAVRSVIAFNWRLSKYISMCFTLPLYLDFSCDEIVNSEKVRLFCCAVALRLNVGSA